MKNKPTTPVSVGIIISLILIVITLITYFAGLYTETWSQYIGFAIFFAGIIWAVYNHGKENDNVISFGVLFGYGFKIVAVIICLMIAYTLLSGYLFPDIKEKIIETAREQALAKPGVDQVQIEQGMEMFAKNYNLFIILGLLFWYIIGGALASLIGAAITKKRPQQSTFENI